MPEPSHNFQHEFARRQQRDHERKEPDREIKNPILRNSTRLIVGFVILVFILVTAWWLFFNSEDENGGTTTANTSAANITFSSDLEALSAQDVIDRYADLKYDFEFSKHSDVDGYTNHIGYNGSTYFQVFSMDDNVMQLSLNFQVSDNAISDDQVDLATNMAGYAVDSDFKDWVEDVFESRRGDYGFGEFLQQELFHDGAVQGRVQCETVSGAPFCNSAIRWLVDRESRSGDDASVFNFEWIGEETVSEPVLDEELVNSPF